MTHQKSSPIPMDGTTPIMNAQTALTWLPSRGGTVSSRGSRSR
jgi:hypothetical protein